MEKVELTILMPCLNEERTLEVCIKKAQKFLKRYKVKGEVLIADNGSTDKSIEIAKKNNARVINVEEKGYGAALIAGINAAYGKYVIMGDCDDSYDFLNLDLFVDRLREGNDLVMGDRFKGGIEKGAMPPLHKYIGNPVLSFIGRLFYGSKVKDFHCGLRGFNRERILQLNLQCPGMEFASEMVVKAELNKFKISQVPTTLKKDGRDRKPHLNSFRDGYRHLRFLIINTPKWLFLIPSMILMVIGILGIILLANGQFNITSNASVGIHTMLYSSSFIIIGVLLFGFYILDKLYSYNVGFILELDKFTNKIVKTNSSFLIIFGLLLILGGIVMSVISLIKWKNVSFGTLNPELFMPSVIIANSLLVIGFEIVFISCLISIMKIKIKK